MSAAAQRDLIYRCLAAADQGKTAPLAVGEAYPYDEARQAFYVRATEIILRALATAGRAPKRHAPKPPPPPPPSAVPPRRVNQPPKLNFSRRRNGGPPTIVVEQVTGKTPDEGTDE